MNKILKISKKQCINLENRGYCILILKFNEYRNGMVGRVFNLYYTTNASGAFGYDLEDIPKEEKYDFFKSGDFIEARCVYAEKANNGINCMAVFKRVKRWRDRFNEIKQRLYTWWK